jgi:hypothetical protein
MPRIEWSKNAVSALDQLVLSHSLPIDTRERVKNSLRPLERFPRFGPELAVLSDGIELRFLIGPWPWLVLVYLYDESAQRIVVVSPEDGRAATSTITRQRPHLR